MTIMLLHKPLRSLFCLLFFCTFYFSANAQQPPYFQWVKGLQGYHDAQWGAFNWGSAIKADAKGNVFIAGSFIRSVDFDPEDKKVDSQSSYPYWGGYFAKYDSLGNHIWARTTKGTEVNCLYVDDSGYIYIGGKYHDTTDFDPGPAKQSLPVKGGNGDFFVAKYSPTGEFKWVRGSGGTSGDMVNGVVVDNQGNVYITGGMHGTAVDFNERSPGTVVYQTAVIDGFVAKYDRHGNYIWSKQINGNDGDVGNGITMDASGNIYVAGYSNGAKFDGTPSSYVPGRFQGTFTHDAFIAKYTSAGTFMWAKTIGGPGEDLGQGLALDKAGNILLTGIFVNTVVFDSSIAGARITANSYSGDAFVAKFTNSGAFLWAKGYGGRLGASRGNAVAVDDSSNVFVGGYFSDSVNFNPGGSPAHIAAAFNSFDIFLVKLRPDGSYAWSKAYGNRGADEIRSIYLDKKYNIYFTGYIGRTTTFEPGTGGSVVVNNPNPNDFQNTIFCRYAQVKPIVNRVAGVGKLALKAYPNPVTEQMIIDGFTTGSRIVPVVTDVTGKQYYLPYTSAAARITIHTGTLAPGIYFVRCTDEAGNSGMVKMLKTE